MIFRSRPYRDLEDRIGHRFRKTLLLETALFHPSALNEKPSPNQQNDSNQRLEFLGDAVLGLLAAEWLFERFPDAQEGRLTKLRATLTNAQTLAQIASTFGLGAFLVLGKGEENNGGRTRESTLSDAMEAILGAVYLDGGLKAARTVFTKHFTSLTLEVREMDGNPKGRLQEWAQQHGLGVPRYQILSEGGPPHARTYHVGVYIHGELRGQGSASNKRMAEANAATLALLHISSSAEPEQAT